MSSDSALAEGRYSIQGPRDYLANNTDNRPYFGNYPFCLKMDLKVNFVKTVFAEFGQFWKVNTGQSHKIGISPQNATDVSYESHQ